MVLRLLLALYCWHNLVSRSLYGARWQAKCPSAGAAIALDFREHSTAALSRNSGTIAGPGPAFQGQGPAVVLQMRDRVLGCGSARGGRLRVGARGWAL